MTEVMAAPMTKPFGTVLSASLVSSANCEGLRQAWSLSCEHPARLGGGQTQQVLPCARA